MTDTPNTSTKTGNIGKFVLALGASVSLNAASLNVSLDYAALLIVILIANVLAVGWFSYRHQYAVVAGLITGVVSVAIGFIIIAVYLISVWEPV